MELPENRELHRIVSTAIIEKNGKFLITKRAPDKKVFPGRWTVPGGGLETDDYVNTPPTTKNNIWYFALENSLRREVTEEVGIEIGKVNYLLDLAFIRPDKMPVITLSFYAPYKSGEVKINSESVDYAWIDFEESKKYDLIDGIREEIEMVDKILKGEDPSTVKFNGK
ncbi:NUDIX domain-containing protein [Candidatus Giovannonibacteria bacterium]|nr:NUDIX domain-containing protein [Candidatus Giovannonibacteria bacterium]